MDPTGGAMGVIPDLLAEATRYVGGANLRENLAPNVYDTGAPLVAHLHYHHEMEYLAESIESISFVAIKMPKSPSSGATYISDTVATTKELLGTPLGQKMKAKGVCYVRKLPDLAHFQDNPDTTDARLVFNYWQTCFETDDPGEAERIAKAKGLEVSWVDSPVFGRYMLTKFYISGSLLNSHVRV
ncbi:hypothetical protein T484DRAFT_1811446 [Baffinella frigidus]|nr:hypothetical protein T484DRAFT_1811446 [Cryptophyta sp. CCMP2293]